jgi:CBS domain-containing protein/YHS domain-containing protein
MQVREVMTKSPVCCMPETSLREVARLMVEFNCGEIPVINGRARQLVGVITDRDITVRTLAEGRNPLDLAARDCMTTPVVTVTPETSVEECCQAMEAHKIRRIPVVDEGGGCCGIVAQADVALKVPAKTAEVVREVSRHDAPPAQPAPAMATDPVCGMRVDPNRAAAHASYEGVTYYFCSDACRQQFVASPGDYAAPATSP